MDLLIINNNDPRLKLLRFLLESAGFSLHEAPDTQAAINLLQDSPSSQITDVLISAPALKVLLDGASRSPSEAPNSSLAPPPAPPPVTDTTPAPPATPTGDIEKRLNETLALLEAKTRECALAQSVVKEFSGFVPICAHCKKVRNPKNIWQPIEIYLSQRTRMRFSHSFCPDCYQNSLRTLTVKP